MNRPVSRDVISRISISPDAALRKGSAATCRLSTACGAGPGSLRPQGLGRGLALSFKAFMATPVAGFIDPQSRIDASVMLRPQLLLKRQRLRPSTPQDGLLLDAKSNDRRPHRGPATRPSGEKFRSSPA